jgi:hypothetical protein
METRRIFWLFCLSLALILFNAYPVWSQPLTGGQPNPELKGPVITHAFAVEKGYYGYIWKIYIEADDPGGGMYKIASVVDQVGYGHYPTDWIILKGQYRHHLKGYIQWNTFSSAAPYLKEWTQITLKVSIFDKAGNESNVVVFPFTFESGVKDQYKYALPSPFDHGDLPRLGHIMIELVQPDYGNAAERVP